MTTLLRAMTATALVLATANAASAQTEFHYQFGHLVNPFATPEATTATTHILTLQQASTWKGGDSFFFVDIIEDTGIDGFNEKDFYGEWYPSLSLGNHREPSGVGADPRLRRAGRGELQYAGEGAT